MIEPYAVPTRHMEPFEVKCYSCGDQGMTKVTAEKSIYQWILFWLLCGMFWFLCLCWIPFCKKSWRNYDHFCQSCGTHVASRSRS